MAGSRCETVGTVFSRVQGLLRSGALKDVDKPVWYDVMATFPPRIEPRVDRLHSDIAPVNILYHEDVVRAKFYKKFGNPDVINMMKEDKPSLSQRFTNMYISLQKKSQDCDSAQLFQEVVGALKAEGIVLKTLEEISREQKALQKPSDITKAAVASVAADRSSASQHNSVQTVDSSDSDEFSCGSSSDDDRTR